jgi:hypothetical protein
MSLSEELLMAYADEQLEGPARAQVEAGIAADPQIAKRVAQHRALRARLCNAFDRVLDEPVPERLMASARTAPSLQRRNNVVPLRRKPPPARGSWAQLGALAASLAVGIVVGQVLPRLASTEPITRGRNGGFIAGSSLARALSSQLTSEQGAAAPVQIGATLRSRSGSYCRTFAIHASAMVGLACHEEEGWRVRVLADDEPRAEHPAGFALPAHLTQAIMGPLASEPLDERAEAAAMARGWR